MAQRILGMGDITTLVEKAQEQLTMNRQESWRKNPQEPI